MTITRGQPPLTETSLADHWYSSLQKLNSENNLNELMKAPQGASESTLFQRFDFRCMRPR